MDKVLSDTLKANLKAARTPEERDNALTLAMIAVVDCQYKTSERVKRLSWRVLSLALGTGGGLGAIASNWEHVKQLFFN